MWLYNNDCLLWMGRDGNEGEMSAVSGKGWQWGGDVCCEWEEMAMRGRIIKEKGGCDYIIMIVCCEWEGMTMRGDVCCEWEGMAMRGRIIKEKGDVII